MAHDNPAKPALSPTAWQRWEPVSLDDPPAAANANDAAAPSTPTAESLEKLRDEARRQGYQAGHQVGYADGREEGLRAGHAETETALREQAEKLTRALAGFDDAASRLEQHVADELLALALEIARQVVGQAVRAQPRAILEVIHAALAELPLQHALIRLHPQDIALVRDLAGEQLAHAGHRLHEDAQLRRGDVLIELGQTQLDARLVTRWQRTVAALTQDAGWLASDVDPPTT
jgi:flagellar assembly protein FliH